MTRRLRIEWAPGEKVTARLAMPAIPRDVGVVLAHGAGAGAGQDHPWIVAVRDLLAGHGYPTMTFNYAYTEAERRSPDRPDKLLTVHGAAADRMRDYVDGVVLAGKSMGGRMASHLAGDRGWPTRALVYLGYPLVPIGKGEPRPTDHLRRIDVPQLFIAGTRDRLSPPALIGPLAKSLRGAQLHLVPDGDHSLRVPKRTGRSEPEVLEEVADVIVAWLKTQMASSP